MKKILFALILFLSGAATTAKVQNVSNKIYFQVGLVDQTENNKPIKKSPVIVPSVSINNCTLSFETPCDGCTLRLINEDGEEVYSIVIPTGTTIMDLPSFLSGDYQLEILRGQFRFYGFIFL